MFILSLHYPYLRLTFGANQCKDTPYTHYFYAHDLTSPSSIHPLDDLQCPKVPHEDFECALPFLHLPTVATVATVCPVEYDLCLYDPNICPYAHMPIYDRECQAPFTTRIIYERCLRLRTN